MNEFQVSKCLEDIFLYIDELNNSFFYPESGGQHFDQGYIYTNSGCAFVSQVIKIHHVFLHKVKVIKGYIFLNTACYNIINIKRRRALSINHTTTHILHAILKNIFGNLKKYFRNLKKHSKFDSFF